MNSISQWISQLTETLSLLGTHFFQALLMVMILWCVHIVNALLRYRLNVLGIYPRRASGLIGIPCFSFLHGDFSHLFLNSIPLIILIDFILLEGMAQFICTTVTIIGLSGIAIWLFARPAFHIGASALVMGYWGYLLANAYQHPSSMTIILALLCLYYFGSLWLNLFPTDKKTSWEGHVFGFLAGIFAIFICF
jgi:membrane associated rhomboid family serine protease